MDREGNGPASHNADRSRREVDVAGRTSTPARRRGQCRAGVPNERLDADEHGHTCVDVLDRVFECQPDVIITDMALPGVDGEELCRRIRQNPVTRAIPIIAATGWAMPAKVERARQAGCDRVFVKPCSISDLLDAVRHVVSALPPLHDSSGLGASS